MWQDTSSLERKDLSRIQEEDRRWSEQAPLCLVKNPLSSALPDPELSRFPDQGGGNWSGCESWSQAKVTPAFPITAWERGGRKCLGISRPRASAQCVRLFSSTEKRLPLPNPAWESIMFYRWRNWGTEWLNNPSQGRRLVYSVRIWIHIVWLQTLYSTYIHILLTLKLVVRYTLTIPKGIPKGILNHNYQVKKWKSLYLYFSLSHFHKEIRSTQATFCRIYYLLNKHLLSIWPAFTKDIPHCQRNFHSRGKTGIYTHN